MPDSVDPITSRIIGRGLISAEAIYQEIRERIIQEFGESGRFITLPSQLESVRQILEAAEPTLASHLSDTQLAAWLAGFWDTSKQFPRSLQREFEFANEGPAKPPGEVTLPWGDDEPLIRFPLLDNAAESLLQRGILTREQFDEASAAIKQQSFTIAGEHTTETLTKFRDELWRDVSEGTSLDSYSARVQEIADASSIGPARVENIYRTNVQAAFRDGRETLAANPIVSEMFPYQQYLPIHDARARKEHRDLEFLGLNGTNIYRREDPFWDSFTPPWSWMCRCGVSLLTLKEAASLGVSEASEWLETGFKPPLVSRLPFIPFEPKPGFGGRGRVLRMSHAGAIQ